MRHIFVIGDSISIQYGPYLKEQLEGEFGYDRKRGETQAMIDLDQPLGANGGDSSMVMAYLESAEALGTKYDILLLNCGLHDLKTDLVTGNKQITLVQYRDNISGIVDLACKMSNSLVWIRTTDVIDHIHNAKSRNFHRFHADVLEYNAAADAIMRERGILILDLYGFSSKLGEEAFLDHVHYTDEVRKLQAAFISGYVHAQFADA
ncbi:Lysophospholipase L1 [Paenibacillus sp. 1_12]|uniref:SGNH/GDSL hydrolase family protein n=1 Tax=Paenibacillus sp. 1_12 TaxID=1566278 RepID=UPI0008DF318F|nr:SGNH/GDSL hydrolase family protein [Paenibacillus sp. 1_12]SFL16321.1 Lysophospholipase L1 [Paenibacillus sp. 1_12]